MYVVAAGMAYPIPDRTVRHILLILHPQGIHIRPDRYGISRPACFQDSQDRAFCKSGPHLKSSFSSTPATMADVFGR